MKTEIYGHRMADGKDYFGLRDGETQQIVTPVLYDEVVPLTESLFRIGVNGCQGVMNERGEEVVPPVYDRLAPFDTEATCFWAEQGDYMGIVRADGAVSVPFVYRLLRYDAEGHRLLGWRVAAVDPDGSEAESIPLPESLCVEVSDADEPAYGFVYEDCPDGGSYVGLQDRDGECVVPCRYAEIRPLYGDYLLVRTHEDRYGVACMSQGEVIPPDTVVHTPYYDTTWYYRSLSRADDGVPVIRLCLAHDRFRVGTEQYFICNRNRYVEHRLEEPAAGETPYCIFAAVEDEDDGRYPLEAYLSLIGSDDVVLNGRGEEVTNIGEIIRQETMPDASLRPVPFKDASGNVLGYDYLLPTGARKFHRLFREATGFLHGYAFVHADGRSFFIDGEGNEFDSLHDVYYQRRQGGMMP